MADEEPKRSSPKQSGNGEKRNCVFSPGFTSVAAMAGWDEEALLMASLVVEDTPDRDPKQKRRSDPMFKTPPTHSRRKRRDQRKSPVSKFVADLDLCEEESSRKEGLKEKKDEKIVDSDVNCKKDEKLKNSSAESTSIPCIDRLREELSCAICLEICFEPSTTSCGHSFCKKCLRSAADKCGKRCPKCRQLISNGRSCTINTVLWNTIQLLFPQEIEARKVVAGATESVNLQSPPPARRRNQYRSVIEALNSPEGEQLSLERRRRTSNNHHHHNSRLPSFRPASVVLLNSREAGDNSVSRRRRQRRQDVAATPIPEQDEDAALALRLQREEFMGAFGGSEQQPQQHRRNSVATATVNLRAMATRAINIRNQRGR